MEMQKTEGKLKIHQYLILGCLDSYKTRVNARHFYSRLNSIFPQHFKSIKTFYHHLDVLNELQLIDSEISNTILPQRRIRITREGDGLFRRIFQPLLILHQKVQKKEEKKRVDQKKTPNMNNANFFLDKSEQIDLIMNIQYNILNFNDEDMELLDDRRKMKLKISAKQIMKNLCQNFGIGLDI